MSTSSHPTDDPAGAADILVDAFTDDPLFRWIFPGATHVGALQQWWPLLTAAAVVNEHAELWVDAGGASAALWYAPRFDVAIESSSAHLPADDQSAGGRDEAPSASDEMLAGLLGARLDEVLAAFAAIADAHTDPPANEPHWYLAAVGTRPARQGRGSGAALLRPVLDRCDEQGLGAYLESSNPRNVPFYHRLGFEILGELVLAGGATGVTRMWRRPR